MAVLVSLNGPPASGKSTIAQRFVDSRPLGLDLDIDVVRGMLGGWLDDPSTAGLAARALALVMAETHLAAGHDVIVPQFLGRTDFIDQLAGVAARSAATFVETALWIDRSHAIKVFADRRAAPSTQAHHDAAALVDRSELAEPGEIRIHIGHGALVEIHWAETHRTSSNPQPVTKFAAEWLPESGT